MDIFLAIKGMIAGVIIGAIFERLKLPIPAPPVLSGVLGVLGVIVGTLVVKAVM